ncbi:MAG: fimbrial protein, partial [Candidatus Cryptobacteroides sp.]
MQQERALEMVFKGDNLPDSVDLFIFNDDRLRRIESFQRLPVISGRVEALTSEGDKIAVALANAPSGIFSERMPESYTAMQSIKSDLSLENGGSPIMSAQVNWSAHSSGQVEMSLSRLGSEIFIRSLACDFSGTEYEGEMLTDVSVYLINVNGRCPVIGDGDALAPEEIVNSGHLELSYLEKMQSPQMLYAEIDSPIGKQGVRTDISLYCYPNESDEATVGSPYTCLVIEGKICGRTWYYPIPVNRDNDGRGGVSRNCRYTYDILIRRAGSSDPSIPVVSGAVITGFAVGDWKENDKVTVGFSVGGTAAATPFASSYDPDENKVHDLNIFLFNEDKKLEYKAFVPNPSYWYSDGLYKWEVPLLSGCRYTLYAVANIGFSLPCRNFKEFEAYRYYLSYPDDYRIGIPMISTLEFVAEGFDDVIPSILERMMAKICVSVDRSHLDKDVSFDVKKVFVRNCPRSASLIGRSRARTEEEVFSIGFLKEGDDLKVLNDDAGGGLSGEVCLYLLENCQGNLLPGNEDYSKKILSEDKVESSLCSYLEMYVSY